MLRMSAGKSVVCPMSRRRARTVVSPDGAGAAPGTGAGAASGTGESASVPPSVTDGAAAPSRTGAGAASGTAASASAPPSATDSAAAASTSARAGSAPSVAMSTPPIQLRSTPFFARGRVSLHRAAIRASKPRAPKVAPPFNARVALARRAARSRRDARARPEGGGRRARRRRPGSRPQPEPGSTAGASGTRTGRAWSASWRCGLKTLLNRQSMRTKLVWPRASSRAAWTAVPFRAARPRCFRFRTCCVRTSSA